MSGKADKKSLLNLLTRISDILLSESDPVVLRTASIELHDLFSEISKLDVERGDSSDWQVSMLPSGQAISPIGAARCVLDFARTAKFFRGMRRAAQILQTRFPGVRLDVLYAGCGPFATLGVLLAATLAPAELKLTLLDVHQRSLDSARRIFAAFGLEDRVAAYVQADAANYRHPRAPHLIVTEVMKRALEKEPQVAVTCNLAPQLARGGIFIPEKVTVDACLYEPSAEFTCAPAAGETEGAGAPEPRARQRRKLARLIELSAESAPAFTGKSFLPPIAVDLLADIHPKYGLLLATTVTILDSLVLDEHDSILTIPLIVHDFDPDAGNIVFRYLLGNRPKFEWKFSTSRASVSNL